MAVRMLCVAILASVLAGSMEGHAQTKSTSKSGSKASSTSKNEADSKYRRLPTYFGQLKLEDKQREEVYEVRAEFGPKLEELEKQLEKMRADMMKKMEAALTTTQKRELTKLRGGTSGSSTFKSSTKASGSIRKQSGSTRSQTSTKKSGSTRSTGSKSSSRKSSSSKKSGDDDKG